MKLRRTILPMVVAVVVVVAVTLPFAQVAQVQNTVFFPQTNFSISNPTILDYFNSRGGVQEFGYPVSRAFILSGTTVQIFQRQVIQINNGSATVLNLLGSDLMPYTSINGAILPAPDPTLVGAAPPVGSPDYATNVINFVRQNAPDVFQGLPVNFGQTFFNTVTSDEVFPNGNGDDSLLPGFDLELWGVPISQPAFDPNNFNFVYQRFQRGVMHFDKATGLTQPLLLAQYFKSIITGTDLPPDLAQEAKNSPYFMQYNNTKPLSLNNPANLPNTDMTGAFEPEQPPLPTLAPGAPTYTPSPTPTSTLTPTPAPATATPFAVGSGCNNDVSFVFTPSNPVPGNVVTTTVTSPTSYNSVNLVGPGAPHFIGAGSGGLGFVWQWRVLVTDNGLFNYDFFVNATQLCGAGFINVGGATAVPATPTNTPTPTFTPTSIPTPAVPSISSVTPLSITFPFANPTPIPVTIGGSNFGFNASAANGQPTNGQVLVNGAAVTVSSWSTNSITALVPPIVPTGPTNVQVVVNGLASNVVILTVNHLLGP